MLYSHLHTAEPQHTANIGGASVGGQAQRELPGNSARGGTPGVIPFLTAGFPTIEETIPLLSALVDGGADAIELGVPFSDPLADGPTIQRASFHALKQGVNLGTCITICRQLRYRQARVPLVFMGYYNPILSYGTGAVCP